MFTTECSFSVRAVHNSLAISSASNWTNNSRNYIGSVYYTNLGADLKVMAKTRGRLYLGIAPFKI